MSPRHSIYLFVSEWSPHATTRPPRDPPTLVVRCAWCAATATSTASRPPRGWRLVQTSAGVLQLCSQRCDDAWHGLYEPGALARIHR